MDSPSPGHWVKCKFRVLPLFPYFTINALNLAGSPALLHCLRTDIKARERTPLSATPKTLNYFLKIALESQWLIVIDSDPRRRQSEGAITHEQHASWYEHNRTITYRSRATAVKSETLPKLLLKLQWAVNNINNQANDDKLRKVDWKCLLCFIRHIRG